MKICSLYGAGFYYIPGTDICLKVGGWTRAEYAYRANGSMTTGPFAGAVNTRATNESVWRARGYITLDARNQTAYGTVRSYIAVGFSGNDVGTGAMDFSANRAFIQWAGFTFGHATSFYDFYSSPATAYFGYYPGSDTGDGGWKVAAYTAQFGGGLSATIAAEMARRTTIINGSGGTPYAFGALPASGVYGGFDMPDIVANLRVDQAWGSAQIMGALHQVKPTYYTGVALAAHPSDKLGYAIGAGIKLNAPMIGTGDYLQAMISYAEGATRYNFNNPNFNNGYASGSSLGFGIISDAVYGGTGATATSQELTKSWALNVAYEHFWNPAWRTSAYGGYGAVSYSSQANAMLCAAGGFGVGAGSTAVATAGCSNNWSVWWLGTRTQWNVTKDFYMGLDVLYQNLQTASVPGNALAGGVTVGNQDNVSFRFRVHRDFMP